MRARWAWLALLLGGAAVAQDVAPTVLRSDAGEVLVDIVVRDRHGRLVKDLKASEVTLQENGVARQVTSFRAVQASERRTASAAPEVQSAGPVETSLRVNRQIRLVSLVFEGLGTDGRRNARNAALDFIQADLGPNVFYAVFYIHRTFRPVLPYTNDPVRLRAAIDRVTGFSKAGGAAGPSVMEQSSPGGPAVDPADVAGARGPDFTGAISSMAEFNNRMDTNMFGAVNIFSLWGIISELGRLPGRKTVLYFSEGLTLPYDYHQHYLSMISAANRANVTVYAVDARGLVTGSDFAASRHSLQGAVAVTQDVTTRPATEGSGMYGAREMGMDRAMQSIWDHKQQNLFDLAEKTGGFLIANRNDFRQPMRQLSEDFNTYYEVTYRPANLVYDGRFHSIGVTVARQGVKVQSREGYFALPSMEGQAVFPFEVPLLHALGRAELPKELRHEARVLQFGSREGHRQAALLIEMPLDQIQFMKDEKGTQARSYISLLALVKDSQGRVVTKLSKELPMDHSFDRVALYKQGRAMLVRPLTLPEGHYTLESVVSDHVAGKQAARRSAFAVTTGAQAAPALSDICLVRALEPAAETAPASNPLLAEGHVVVPSLQQRFQAAPGARIAVFSRLYAGAGPAVLYLDLLRDGKVVRREQSAPGAAAPDGSYPILTRMALDSLPAGDYELRLAAVQGERAARRSIALTLE